MYQEGKMDIAGPLLEDIDIGEICIYNVQDKEELIRLCNLDPAVSSGRLVAEIHPPYDAKGSLLKQYDFFTILVH